MDEPLQNQETRPSGSAQQDGPPSDPAHGRTGHPHAQSWSAFLDKHLRFPDRGMKWHAVGTVSLIVLVFTQDNLAGRINDWQELFWTIEKGLALVALVVCVLLTGQILAGLLSRIRRS